jgi:hypothetical protein
VNIYETSFCVACPNGGDGEVKYNLVIESKETIWVEDINAATDIKVPAFHESLADGIFALLGGKQTITARHQGVSITTHRGGFMVGDRGKLANAIKKAYFRRGISDWLVIADEVIKTMGKKAK